MDKRPNRYWVILFYLALAFATAAAFWQVRNCDFVNYDDPAYVTKNQHVQQGLTLDGIRWAFTAKCCGNWHPLTMVSHMLDCQLFGADNPGWHHLHNLLLHIVNTLLLFAVLRQMTGALWRSAFVAAAFALHPLHVESVAWISERKDVLSTLFWILTMAAYLRYVKRTGAGWYMLTLLVFALGLMSKPMLVTLPFVLLLLDYWPLGRFSGDDNVLRWKTAWPLIREKIPFFALSAISSIVTFVVQQSSGAVQPIAVLRPTIRVVVAVVSYAEYINKLLWPSRLAVFYPLGTMSVGQFVMAVLLLVGVSVCVIRLAQQYKYLPVGWLWYLGTLVPVIGLVQVGGQSMADRYSYVPFTGLFIIIAWGVPDMLAQWRYRKIAVGASAIMVLSLWSVCTVLQVRHWRNNVMLFEQAIEVTEGNYIAHNQLGNRLQAEGKLDEAISHYREAIRIKPKYARAHYNLGCALFRLDGLDEAISCYNKALELKPDYAEAENNLGALLAKQRRFHEAIGHFRQALQIKPDYAEARQNLAKAKAILQQGEPK